MFRLHPNRHWKTPVARRIVAALIAAALFLVAGGLVGGVHPAFASGATIYVHTTTSANTSGDYTLLDNTVTNNNPNALVFVTVDFTGGAATNFDNHQTGVWYDFWEGKWSIFNEDQAAMPIGASFNVYALSQPASGLFVQTVTTSNTWPGFGYITLIDNPALNGNPSAHFLVTQNWNPGGKVTGGVYNNHAIGVWYSSLYGKWAIYNEDRVNLPIGASFNVVNITGVGHAFTQVATTTNTTGDSTCMNNSLLNGNFNAVAFIVHNYGTSGPYMADVTAVYFSISGKWCIFDGSYANMPLGTSFFVFV